MRLGPALLTLAAALLAQESALAQESPDPPSANPPEVKPVSSEARKSLLGPVDWFRAGIIYGPQYRADKYGPDNSFHIQLKMQWFGLDWRNFYYVPLVFTFGGYAFIGESTNSRIDFAISGEIGYVRNWGPNQLRVGIAIGMTFGGEHKGSTLVGANLRPTIRYRHYWDRFGLEFSLEWPTILGYVPGFAIDDPGYGDGAQFWYELPLVGITVGM